MPLSYTIPAGFPNSACPYRKGTGCQLVREVERVRADDYVRVQKVSLKCPAFKLMVEKTLPLVGDSEHLMYSKVAEGRFMGFSKATTDTSDLQVTVRGPVKGEPACEVGFDYMGEDDHRGSVIQAYDSVGIVPVDRDPPIE